MAQNLTDLPAKGKKPLLKWLTGNVLPVLAVGVVTCGVSRWSYEVALPYIKGKVMGFSGKSKPVVPAEQSESDEA